VKEALAWSPSWWLLRLLLAVVVDLERFSIASSVDSAIAPSEWGTTWRQPSPASTKRSPATVMQQRTAIKTDVKFKSWTSQAPHLNAICANLRRCIRGCISLGPWCVALGEEWVDGWSLDTVRSDLELPTLTLPAAMTAPYPLTMAAP
jgi:hypothetical protein